MGRKRKGRDISGWLVIDKPAGPTSTAVVNKVRWALDAKKAGHAGTLDPEATGVLAVALGEATKTVPYITDALKAYTFTMRLGIATNTDDAEGEVIATSDLRPGDDAIKSALSAFIGDIEQVPPQFSAVKIDGERAYKRARDGEAMDIAARPLWVESLLLIDRPDADHATLEMVCGKGGYVRAIARDLGAALGCHAHVRDLRRIWSGPFDAEDGLTLEQIDAMAKTPELDAHLLPLETGLTDLPEVTASAEGAQRLRNGNPGMVFANDVDYGDTCWASRDGRAVAVGIFRSGELHPSRVFNAPPGDDSSD
ncbi:tRNA pseudouridine(55) synthase TruB [Sulfitobacter aestuariivivens]|uniref:tRNA pseudouridine synthase B n=1 Tax=Sulfitobacter aestuariivivens TaxID=2766981 RepID=A0A927HGP9_9RHOB|nr:tRNA pseudouridine(55) synthase TruB [Sulfitobacter aestuariivivens]MBD3665723.1 tRNA pseudouridine(55) synthase TruB [Sulfitobacter aestuariivivens]